MAVGQTPMSVEGGSLRLTISIGAVRAADRHDTLDSLVETADRCLYVAKRQGRDRVSLVPHVPGVRSPAPSVPATHRPATTAPSESRS